MSTPRLAELASKLLRNAASEQPYEVGAEQRAKTIALMDRAMRRRQQHRRAGGGVMAVAAITLVGIGARYFVRHAEAPSRMAMAAQSPESVTVIGHPTGTGATVLESGSSAPMVEGRSLPPGSRIVAHAHGHASLSLSTGTQISIEEDGDFSIIDNTARQLFALRTGAVRAQVSKLAPEARFVIQTPDAEVEVRGTSFRVFIVAPDPACEGGTVTRVEVEEGVVSVRHAGRESPVGGGQSWPLSCEAPPALVTPEQHALAPRGSKSRLAVPNRADHASSTATGAAAGESSPEAPRATEAASDLAQQNDAFANALAIKKRGSPRAAIQLFEDFVSRYPASSLVESALVQRLQLLQQVDPQRAASAAGEYLSRYPNGFARADAEAIARQAPRVR